MGKVSLADKMRMQTLHEQGYGAKAIVAAYPWETGSWVWWRKFASELMQQVRRLNARPVVVDRNPRAQSQTSNVLKSSFALKKVRVASTRAPVRSLQNSISVTGQSGVQRRKTSISMRFAGFQHKSSTPAQNKSDWSVPQLCFVDSKFVTTNVFSSPTRNFF